MYDLLQLSESGPSVMRKNTTNRNKACQFNWNVAYFIKESICTASIYCSHYKEQFYTKKWHFHFLGK